MNDSDSSTLTLKASADDAGKRLDSFLAEKIRGWSRTRLARLIDNGDVLVNEKPSKAAYKILGGEAVDIDLTEAPVAAFEPENIPLDIVYEDEYLAVINKPAGMVVHPGAGVDAGTLANAIAWHFKFQIPDSKFKNRVGIVHRLDKDTSGLIVVAKDEQTHEALSEQFANREVYKSYVALVHGEMPQESGRIESPIGRDRNNRLKMAVRKEGRSATSLWKVRQRFDRFTLVDVEIKTGRTHQIRVHLSSIHHPVVGDDTYNQGRDQTVRDVKIRTAISGLGRFFLHAEKLSFTHPKNGERMDFTSPLPPELLNFLSLL